MIPSRLFLCGFMGSGKTTVGPHLSRRLNYSFIDTDAEIEQRTGQRVADIFALRGESHFRLLEKGVLESLVARKSVVIALGGGVLLNPELLLLVRKTGFLIYLRTSPETLKHRLRNVTDRPLLSGSDFQGLFESRRAGYESADYVVDTDQRTPEEVVEHILTSAFFEL